MRARGVAREKKERVKSCAQRMMRAVRDWPAGCSSRAARASVPGRERASDRDGRGSRWRLDLEGRRLSRNRHLRTRKRRHGGFLKGNPSRDDRHQDNDAHDGPDGGDGSGEHVELSGEHVELGVDGVQLVVEIDFQSFYLGVDGVELLLGVGEGAGWGRGGGRRYCGVLRGSRGCGQGVVWGWGSISGG